jgi:hypothetical protein
MVAWRTSRSTTPNLDFAAKALQNDNPSRTCGVRDAGEGVSEASILSASERKFSDYKELNDQKGRQNKPIDRHHVPKARLEQAQNKPRHAKTCQKTPKTASRTPANRQHKPGGRHAVSRRQIGSAAIRLSR